MFSIIRQEAQSLDALGGRLRTRRIDAGDTQVSFAARIGISVPTYRKMEKGDETVPIGYWIRALRLLGGLDSLDDLLPVSLLSEAHDRQRAPRTPAVGSPRGGRGPLRRSRPLQGKS